MKLYIAEKPSLGKSIAENLPGTQKKGEGFIEMSNGDVVTWAAGHFFELADPKYYAKGKDTFDIKNLPFFPEAFVLLPKDTAAKQLRVLEHLLKSATSVVNCGDADREGEAIIVNIIKKFKYNGPTERLWLSAMDAASVKKSLGSMKSGNDPFYVGMYNAAIARSQEDWLVGMNLSPSVTVAARKSGFKGFISIGRVQTPTLGLVVNRDNEIENFVAKNFFTVAADVGVAKGQFIGKYKIPPTLSGLDSEGRISDKKVADAIVASVQGKSGILTKYETKREKELAPLPFSLSALQIYANSRWGYGAQLVLDTCQALYETHALTSYPRTDCEFLPESQHADAANILNHLKNNFTTAGGANTGIKSRVFNDKKITAHHAIIPTGKAAIVSTLKKTEADLYEAISLRYIANFYPDYVFDKTNVETTFNQSDVFATSGRIDVTQGWRVVLPSTAKKNDDEAQSLPQMTLNEATKAIKVSVESKKTTAPAYFTEGTLIEAMTNVHKFVTNPDIKRKLKEVAGIGTEATRASVIERLLTRELIIKDGKKIKSSGVAKAVIAAIPLVLKDPGITAMLEDNLAQIAASTLSSAEFMANRTKDITRLVEWCRSNTINIPKEFHGGAKGGTSKTTSYKGSAKSASAKGNPFAGPVASSGSKEGSIALKVPYDERNAAKDLGARWNPESKIWFIAKGADTKPFAKWLPTNKMKM